MLNKPHNNGRRDGRVTVVIATYLRADALRLTLQTLYRQTYRNWRALVICDHCPKEHLEQLQPLDPRARYINLPIRCGQQYGPNSVGIHLADSEYIAFLNHDDLWLEDHLEHAISTLQQEKRDIYLGRAAFCHPKNQPEHPARLLFSELNRPEELWCSMTGPNNFFEPASSWVMKTASARKNGYWHAPDRVAVTPVMDWIARLAGKRSTFAFGKEVSVLKFNLHHAGGAEGQHEYRQPASWLPRLQRYLTTPASQVRNEIAADLASAADKGLEVREHMDGKPLSMSAEMARQKKRFRIYRALRLLPHLVRRETAGLSGKGFAKRTVAQRTGEQIHEFPSPESIIEKL